MHHIQCNGVADLDQQLSEIGLYGIEDYILVNAEDYGVPQISESVCCSSPDRVDAMSVLWLILFPSIETRRGRFGMPMRLT